MQLRTGNLFFSPSDLNAFVECEHLVSVEFDRIHGRLPDFTRPDNPQAELVMAKGRAHEAAFLARLEAEGKTVAHIELGDE